MTDDDTTVSPLRLDKPVTGLTMTGSGELGIVIDGVGLQVHLEATERRRLAFLLLETGASVAQRDTRPAVPSRVRYDA